MISFANQPDLPPFSGRRLKEVPPRLLLQSTIGDADRLIAEDPDGDKSRRGRAAELKAHRDAVIARRRQRVDDIRADKFLPKLAIANHTGYQALRAEQIAVSKKAAVAVQLGTLSRTMRTRSLDANLKKRKGDNAALAEVLALLDEEDRELEPSDSDSDYEDECARDKERSSAEEDADMTNGSNLSSPAEESKKLQSDREECSSSNASDEGKSISSDDIDASDSVQNPHRMKHRKQYTKPKPADTTTMQCDKNDGGDGAFLEGCSRRWESWDDFYREFEVFQAATYQNITSRTSTSVASRNRQMRNAVARNAKKDGTIVDIVEKRKGAQYILNAWSKYCVTLQCTHTRGQPLEVWVSANIVKCGQRNVVRRSKLASSRVILVGRCQHAQSGSACKRNYVLPSQTIRKASNSTCRPQYDPRIQIG